MSFNNMDKKSLDNKWMKKKSHLFGMDTFDQEQRAKEKIIVKALQETGKSCSICQNFIESLIRCKKGKKIVSQFSICDKFLEKEE